MASEKGSQGPPWNGPFLRDNPFTEELAHDVKTIMNEWKVPSISIAVIDDSNVFAQVRAR